MKTMAAMAAADIRKELKKAFPQTKFSVTSDNFSGGNSLDIRWQDGPTIDNVGKLTKKYQAGNFCGYQDCYINKVGVRPANTAQYVQHRRNISEAIRIKVTEENKRIWNGEEDERLFKRKEEERIERILSQTDLT